MKQKLTLALVLVASLLISACGEKNDFGNESSSSTAADPIPLVSPYDFPSGLPGTGTGGTGANPGNNGGLMNPPPLTNDKISAFILELHREIFKGTIHDHSRENPNAVVDYYRKAYNPANGVGCKRIAYVFIANHPARAAALGANGNASSAGDIAMREFITAHYRGLVPRHYAASTYATNSQNVYSWYIQGYLTPDQMADIFLNDAEFTARCQAAGLGL